MQSNKTRRIIIRGLWGLAALTVLFYLFCLPRDLFKGEGWSAVVIDRNGELLGARIAEDGQWRFPPGDSLPEKYVKALIEFEDRWFRWHPGVNPVSIFRSAVTNIRSGHIVSGGSTISMQVIRMSRDRERTMWQKLVEAVLATRLELRYSKDEILSLYASHAPFGGNVVGIEAASWRYFGRPAGEMSWAEAATLAILPNSPSSIRPGKNREKLLAKRNRLLLRLFENGEMSRGDYGLACAEPLPAEPSPLPSYASHLVDRLARTEDRSRPIRTSIDINLQRRVEDIVNRQSDLLAAEGINDMAALVADVGSGEILAYCGNSSPYRKRGGSDVDAARSPRSSGSILKPILYCAALENGTLLPGSLIADTPVNINGFAPQNYDLTYDGAVPASEAVSRSLNVPSVHILRKYGIESFLCTLRDCGMTTFTRSAEDYGLSLILGGGECRLDEVVSTYASMSRAYTKENTDFPLGDRVALWHTFNAMSEVNRPDEIDWHVIRSAGRTAWKTGTSYGYRDGWACGVTPAYAAGVWAGNASGVAAPGLIGARTAGPVLFDILNLFPDKSWFSEPASNEGVLTPVCHRSGCIAGPYCEDRDTLLIPKAGLRTETCPYHYRIDGKNIFRLPPAMEWYYRQKHPEYGGVDKNGPVLSGISPMEFIYPEGGSIITLPRQLDGSPGEMVFNLAHHDQEATVYWHLDNEYIGETRFIHQYRLRPSPGHHSVTVVDNTGNTISVGFTIR
ncbi:MAG: penicillin-binding protein 1C [Candidatus Cryptobacteroides sp.]